jgi:hypothetical protein
VDARAFAAPKGLRPRRRDKPAHDEQSNWHSSAAESHLQPYAIVLRVPPKVGVPPPVRDLPNGEFTVH